MKTFKKGQKVKNQFGETLTIRLHNGCQIFVYEDCNGWYHPGNLYAI